MARMTTSRVRLVLGGFVVVQSKEELERLVRLVDDLRVERAESPLCIRKVCTSE